MYLGRTILDKDIALTCEKDLLIKHFEKQKDYCIVDLLNLFEEYFFKRYKETSPTNNLLIFNKPTKKMKLLVHLTMESINSSMIKISLLICELKYIAW